MKEDTTNSVESMQYSVTRGLIFDTQNTQLVTLYAIKTQNIKFNFLYGNRILLVVIFLCIMCSFPLESMMRLVIKMAMQLSN
jgi:hypothetical protein